MDTRNTMQIIMTLFQFCLLALQITTKINWVQSDTKNEILLYSNIALVCISFSMLLVRNLIEQYNYIYCIYKILLLGITTETIINFEKEMLVMIIFVFIFMFQTQNTEKIKHPYRDLMVQNIIAVIYIVIRMTLINYIFRVELLMIWIQTALILVSIIVVNKQFVKKVRISIPMEFEQNRRGISFHKLDIKGSLTFKKAPHSSIKKEQSLSQSLRKEKEESDDLQPFRTKSYNNTLGNVEETDIFKKIIDQFPEGVAILKFQENGNPFVEYCNETMKNLMKVDQHGQLLKNISNLKNQMVISHKVQAGTDDTLNVYKTIAQFDSFSNELNEKNLGVVRRFLKTGSDQLITIPSKNSQSRFMKTSTKSSQLSLEEQRKNVFQRELYLLSIQIFKPAVQNYLMKLRQIFELYTIINGYCVQDEQNERFIEIKMFMSFQNKVPQILLLARDVTHRDHIKLLNSHNKSMSNQLNFVSHEYRTPLNCIITMLEQCQDDEISRQDTIFTRTRRNSNLVPETKLKYIQTALQNCKYLQNLSNDLLDLAQIKVGKFKLRKQTFNLKETLVGCLDMFNILAEKKGIVLKLKYPESVEQIVFQDNNRVQQIIVNLLGNAFKFTLKGAITIEVTQSNNAQLSVAVSDTGVGIKEEDKINLFMAFGRLDSDENKKLNRQGVGLGLLISNMISKNLNQAQNGIRFSSEYGKGTVFEFDFDCLKYFEEESWNQGSSAKKETSKMEAIQSDRVCEEDGSNQMMTSIQYNKDYCGSQINSIPKEDCIQQIHMQQSRVQKQQISCDCAQILVVDDNQFNIDVLQILLLKRNILLIDFTISGDMTITKIKKRLTSKCCKIYKIIFLDLEMPDMSGIQAFQIMSELFQQNLVHVPVIACSGYHKDSLKEKCLLLGMQDYLEKPVNKKELDRILQEYYY